MMRLSALRSLASSCLLLSSHITSAEFLTFEVFDSDERPTEFRDGLYTYLEVENAGDPTM